jgi:putative toxin-antitoxin system antitoxin component (TIGR02293 family)
LARSVESGTEQVDAMAAHTDSLGGRGGNRAVPEVPGSSLGMTTTDLLMVTRKLMRGLSYRTLTQFQKKSGLTLEEVAQVVQIPRRTLARRKVQGRLTRPESERLFRLALVFEKTLSLFEGDTPAARTWLTSPNGALADQSPLVVSETEFGAREVESLIGRLEHGVFT